MSALSASVIIPTHNRARLVSRAVTSVLAATGPEDEVIVVDDASTDETPQVLATFADRIRYLRVQHGGPGAARNRGIREARNPLVAFLDDDDEWMPDKLALQRAFMHARPDVLFCFTDLAVHRTSGDVQHGCLSWLLKGRCDWNQIVGPSVPFSSLARLPSRRQDFRVHVGNLYLSIMEAPVSYICAGTLVVRREAAGDGFYFAEDLRIYEDWECFGRLARLGLGAYLDCETAWSWGHGGPRLTDSDDYCSATARITALKRVWGADPDFLALHGDRFHRVLAELHLTRARWLIRHGRTREARAELHAAEGGPLSHRLLAALPGPMARRLLAVRSAARSIYSQVRGQ